MKKSKTVLDRIFKHIVEPGRNHMVWTGTLESSGTPKVYVAVDEKKNPLYKSVVRILWDDEHKEKLKDDEYLLNTCKVKNCVNPKHFEIRESGYKVLSSEQEVLISEYFERGSPISLLAREFGVSRNTIVSATKRGVKKCRSKV